MRYYGPINPRPLGVRLPSHTRPGSFRSGLGYGGAAFPDAHHLPRPDPHQEYDPVFARYQHVDPSYDHHAPWPEELHSAASTEFALGRPSIPQSAESAFIPAYDDAIMTPELMEFALDPSLDEAGTQDTPTFLEDAFMHGLTAATSQPEMAFGDPMPEVSKQMAYPAPLPDAGYSPLELIALDQDPLAQQLGPAHAFEEPVQPMHGAHEDPLEQLLQMQHELQMNPPGMDGPGMMLDPG